MKKGGYQIIDLSAYKFTNGESQIIKNVYNIIKNTKKVVLISGLTVDDTEYHDMFTVFMDYETFFCGLAQYEGNNICFVVNNDGSVAVNVSEVNKEPVAYLYNGQRLPALPKWDKKSYPYATLRTSEDYDYILSVYSAPFVAVDSKLYILPVETYPTYKYKSFRIENGEWIDHIYSNSTENKGEGGNGISSLTKTIWSNYDILNYGYNTIVFSATDPVPVYE